MNNGKRHTSMINTFMIWYKQQFDVEKSVSMFDKVDPTKTDSTNKQMETLFEHITKYNNETDAANVEVCYPGVFKLDINSDLDLDLYQLEYSIPNDITTDTDTYTCTVRLQCPHLIPLLYYIVDEQIESWSVINLGNT